MENMPQYDNQVHDRSEEQNDMKSSIVAYVTSVKIRKSHPKRKYTPVWHQVHDRSEEQNDMKSSIVTHVTSVKIRKSHLKQKYTPVWHQVHDRSEIGRHEIICCRTCNTSHLNP